MADDATGVIDSTDVQDAEITLDDFNADEKVAAKAEPSSAKEEKPKAEPPKEPSVAKDKAEKTEEVTPPDVPLKDAEAEPDKVKEPEAEAEVVEEKPQTKADERKQQLNTEIRDLVSQRNALRAEVEKANAETYQVATEQELTDQGMTELEAKVEAMRQQSEMDKYNSQVADAQLTLSSESERVLRDFPIFNSEDMQYDKELANEAAELLQANLVVDPNTNQIIGTNPGFSVYNIYKTLAKASGISTAKGQIKGQADTEKQLANVDAASNAAPPKEKVDPLMELWKSND